MAKLPNRIKTELKIRSKIVQKGQFSELKFVDLESDPEDHQERQNLIAPTYRHYKFENHCTKRTKKTIIESTNNINDTNYTTECKK